MNFPAFSPRHRCETCKGYRLKPEALAVKIDDHHIAQVAELSIRDAIQWIRNLPATLNEQHKEIAVRILKEIRNRLKFLDDVGLEYLTLSRSSRTLSGGESQRIRLASQIGSGLTGVLYVLDEPSIGLHQRDNARLLETLKHLRDLGNTVIVVEHDEEAICSADFVIDIGPGAGVHGGKIIAKGPPAKIMSNSKSLTGQYLTGAMEIPLPKSRRKINKSKQLKIVGAKENNLKNVTAAIPIGLFTCLTGVSGGGKSTLLIETFYKAIARKLNNRRDTPGAHTSPFMAFSTSIRSLILTSPRSAVHRDPTRRPIPGPSHPFVSGSRNCPSPGRGAISPAASPSMSKEDAAKPARVTVSSKSKCTSCRTSM